MNDYICIRCNKSFGKIKTHLTNHLKRKNICYPINRDIDNKLLIEKLQLSEYFEFCNELKSQFKCPYCDSYYKHKNSVSRHKKTCVYNPINIHKNEKIKSKQLLLNNSINNITNNNNNNNTTNNINNTTNNNLFNININCFGNEDLSNIDFSKLVFYNEKYFNCLPYSKKSKNHISNVSSILDDILNDSNNINFKLVNKKLKKFVIKNNNDDEQNFNNDDNVVYLNDIQNYYYDMIDDKYSQHITKNNILHYKNFLISINNSIDRYVDGQRDANTKFYKNHVQEIKDLIQLKIFECS